ncbi:hypothetical protein NW754_001469 [Fusarium falciforme]|uniref:ThuA-like domain-containing protein n=1 Tax=Fusarium falciforme TaxID=195108 RepID=A0A9W8QQ07_9HYPO|nr:hypothetical protein NW754_001469 [Fusarium falciforme]KAJ4175591.1 hypothetical protein NW755_014848 [Fusarium falciforme]KAJ4177569.1 hypothetical protein NW759_017419 [Fusarium solani]KAJ4213956.1 hypothetical protein NW757_014739 [Fusarium falciforme]
MAETVPKPLQPAFRVLVFSKTAIYRHECIPADNLDSEWYGRFVGAQFAYHPAPEEGTLVVEDAGHEIMSGSEAGERRWMDEWYSFKTHPRENVSQVLMGHEESRIK